MRHDLYGRTPQANGRVQSRPSADSILSKDTALIFSLVFLLKKENRDPMLILALLYILT